jgi:TolB-like protein/cytochrome c-type biogenesis protein CcmH/NrfG
MGLFQELKRRNVFRVGAAYVLLAWVFLQIVDFAAEVIGAPAWILQLLTVLAALGLPAALIFSWVYEMTPEGLRLEKDIDRSQSITGDTGRRLDRTIIVVLAIAIVVLLVERFYQAPKTVSEHSAGIESPATIPVAEIEPGQMSIAVLPFTDMSAEGDQAYFGDGIAEEILNVLVKTRQLKVAGRTSSFQFRGDALDLREIGQQLGVDHILEGSIRKASNRVRITAQLIKAEDGFHLWSETYDRELDDIFAVQDEIARAITDALAIQLDIAGSGQSLAPVQTTNMVAYENYLEARGLVSKRAEFRRAIQLLEEATRLDPNFSAAWAMLAQANALSFYYGAKDKAEAVRAAEATARHAIQLDPESAEAWSALGDAVRDQTRWNDAWDAYTKALELNPDSVETHSQFGQMLLRLGHMDAALTHTRQAAEIDPLSWVYQGIYGANLWMLGQPDEAWTAMRKSNRVAGRPRSVMTRIQLRMALEQGNRALADEIIQAFAENPDTTDPTDIMHFLELAHLLDQPEQAREYLRTIDITRQKDVNIEMFWTVYFDDMALAREWFAELLSVEPDYVIVDPIWLQFESLAPLRDLDEFRQLQQLYGHDDFWREHGWPDYCRPAGPVDFVCGSQAES